jgi:hypothetical protein
MDIQYIRTGAVPAGEDIRFYDLGKLSLSTVGSQAVAVVGELWATYEVALKKPILTGAFGGDLATAAIVRYAITASAPLGTIVLSSVNNSIGASFSGTVVTLPSQISGKYFISFFWYGGSGAWALPSFVLSGGSYVNYNGFPTQYITATTGTAMVYQAVVSIPDNNIPFTITLGTAGTYGAGPTLDVTIAQLDADTIAT